MNPKQKAVLERIERLEYEIVKGREYLETGAHANWQKFRPLFATKKRDGKELPPHPHWVKNVFIPRRQRTLAYAETLLERLS